MNELLIIIIYYTNLYEGLDQKSRNFQEIPKSKSFQKWSPKYCIFTIPNCIINGEYTLSNKNKQVLKMLISIHTQTRMFMSCMRKRNSKYATLPHNSNRRSTKQNKYYYILYHSVVLERSFSVLFR